MPTPRHINIDQPLTRAFELSRDVQLGDIGTGRWKWKDGLPDYRRTLLTAAAARETLLRHWRKQNAASLSRIGLPLSREAPVYQRNGRYCIDFGGATLSMRSEPGADVEIQTSRRIQVYFQGFGLESRQETSKDDLYGVVTGNVGSLGYTKHWNLAEVQLAGKGDGGRDRISQHSILMWDGAPIDLNIVFSMVERDHGDRAKIRADIRNAIDAAVKEAAALATAGAATTSIAIDNKFNAQTLAQSNIYQWLLTGAAALITKIFGLTDDPYRPGSITIPRHEMQTIPRVQKYRCHNDRRLIDYTHRLTISGRDDDGALGVITGLFLVRNA